MNEARGALSTILGVMSVYLFAMHNVSDAIFGLVLAIWINPK